MSDIKWTCSYCDQHVSIDESARGYQVKCPTCQGDITVPSLDKVTWNDANRTAVIAPQPESCSAPATQMTSPSSPARSAPQVPLRSSSVALSGLPVLQSNVPRLVQGWATFLQVMYFILLAFGIILQFSVGLIQSSQAENLVPLIVSFIGIAVTAGIGWVFIRLAGGLHRGEREAVYGICLLWVLGIGSNLVLFATGYLGMAGLSFGAASASAFYIPPAVVAFRHWGTFK